MELSDNKRCAFPPTQVKIAAHKDLPQQAPEIATFLSQLSMNAKMINRLLLTKKEQSLESKEIAMTWLKENESVWSRWVPREVAQRVHEALR